MSGPAQLVTHRPTKVNLLDPAHWHNIPAQPRIVGSPSRTHLAGSKVGGELMHKLIKVVMPSWEATPLWDDSLVNNKHNVRRPAWHMTFAATDKTSYSRQVCPLKGVTQWATVQQQDPWFPLYSSTWNIRNRQCAPPPTGCRRWSKPPFMGHEHMPSQHSQTYNHPLQVWSLTFQDSIKLAYSNTRLRVLRTGWPNQYKTLARPLRWTRWPWSHYLVIKTWTINFSQVGVDIVHYIIKIYHFKKLKHFLPFNYIYN
jgi:hypothetical protein